MIELSDCSNGDDVSIDSLLGANGFIERKGNAAVLLVHGLTGTPAEMKHFGRVISRQGLTDRKSVV